jgi:hypothetical protein
MQLQAFSACRASAQFGRYRPLADAVQLDQKKPL